MNKIIQEKKNTRFCFFDAETENLTLHECNNKPWQISWIIVDNFTTVKEYDYYLKWPEGLNVSKGAAIATRFDQSIVDNRGVPPLEAVKLLDASLKECDYVVGHNILGFDAYILMAMYRKLGLKPYNIYPKSLDTFALAKAWKLEQPPKTGDNITAWQLRLLHKRTKEFKLNLGALGREFEIDHDYSQLHNALVDLRLNAKVFNKLRKIFSL